MKRNDAVALTTSLVVHVLVLLFLSMTTIGAKKYDPIGYIEVDFGPLAEGRPVQKSIENDADNAKDLAETVEEQTPQQQTAPDEARPVDLPDEVDTQVEEEISTPEVEEISPEVQTTPRKADDPEPQREVIPATPRRGGSTGGTTGSESGTDGAGTDADGGVCQPLDRLGGSGTVHRDLDGQDADFLQNVGDGVDPIGVEASKNCDHSGLDHNLGQQGTAHGEDSVTLHPPSTASTWPVTRLEPSPRR